MGLKWEILILVFSMLSPPLLQLWPLHTGNTLEVCHRALGGFGTQTNYTALRENTENHKNTSVIRSEVTGSSVRKSIFPIKVPFRALFSTFLILCMYEWFGNISFVFQKKRKPLINLLNLVIKQRWVSWVGKMIVEMVVCMNICRKLMAHLIDAKVRKSDALWELK